MTNPEPKFPAVVRYVGGPKDGQTTTILCPCVRIKCQVVGAGIGQYSVTYRVDLDTMRAYYEGVTLPQSSLGEIGFWVAQTCLAFGAEPETAFKVAALFVAGLKEFKEARSKVRV